MNDSGGVAVDASGDATAEPLTTEEEPDTFTQDDAFDLLSSHRRRFTLHLLQETDESVELGELAEHVAAWENDQAVADISATERKRVYTSLQQFHLPKMDKLDVVEFDNREGVIELGPAADDLDVYLEIVGGRDIPWSEYYLGLSAVTLALLTAAAIGVYPFTMLPAFAWGFFAVTAFLISALAHTYISKFEMRLGNTEKPPEVEG